MLVVVLSIAFAVAMGARYYIFEPLQICDSSMYPRHQDRELLWMCKLPQCIDRVSSNETVWAKLRNGETLVRKVVALPGERLEVSDKGVVKTPRLGFRWTDETAFIQSRQVHIPKKGDTLRITQMNDIEEDFFMNLLIEQGEEFFIRTSLWQGDREIGIERLGATKLGNRQVSLQEVNLLPWQDRFLLEQQVFHSETGDTPIQMRREFLRKSDSSRIEYLVVNEDCYFLGCEKGAFCLDSREVGYFTKSRLLGRYVSEPRMFLNRVKRTINENVFNFMGKKTVHASDSAPAGANRSKALPHPRAKHIIAPKAGEKDRDN